MSDLYVFQWFSKQELLSTATTAYTSPGTHCPTPAATLEKMSLIFRFQYTDTQKYLKKIDNFEGYDHIACQESKVPYSQLLY